MEPANVRLLEKSATQEEAPSAHLFYHRENCLISSISAPPTLGDVPYKNVSAKKNIQSLDAQNCGNHRHHFIPH